MANSTVLPLLPASVYGIPTQEIIALLWYVASATFVALFAYVLKKFFPETYQYFFRMCARGQLYPQLNNTTPPGTPTVVRPRETAASQAISQSVGDSKEESSVKN